ncbi:MAG: response regulator [Pirellulaceae bacterium]|jgi:CheY-like chemotaxis protein|nr:response regulator [Pirellulaceae bacterium]
MNSEIANDILIVDDDPAMLRVLTCILKSSGYDIRTARSGQQALKLIEQEAPSFLISDWEMPEMSGSELCVNGV